MKDIDFYIDKAKEHSGFKSDRELSTALGFKGNSVTFWRRKRAYPSDDAMSQLATFAGENITVALIDLNAMRSEGTAHTAYKELRDFLSKTVQTLFVVTLLSSALMPDTAHASITANDTTSQNTNYLLSHILYHPPLHKLVTFFIIGTNKIT